MTLVNQSIFPLKNQKPNIGALVIGQSPRPEIEKEFFHIVGNSANLVLRGALDALSRKEIDSLAPEDDADTLFTRLPNGDGVTISKKEVVRHGKDQLDSLNNDGVAIVILLCTGNFSEWESLDGVLFPSRTVAAMVSGLLPKGKIGVFSPLEEQCAQTKKRWQQRGYEVVSTSLSPNATANEAKIVAKAMVNHAPDLLIFDCISYTRETKRIVSSKTSIPAILGISCAIRSAMELID